MQPNIGAGNLQTNGPKRAGNLLNILLEIENRFSRQEAALFAQKNKPFLPKIFLCENKYLAEITNYTTSDQHNHQPVTSQQPGQQTTNTTTTQEIPTNQPPSPPPRNNHQPPPAQPPRDNQQPRKPATTMNHQQTSNNQDFLPLTQSLLSGSLLAYHKKINYTM